MKIKALKLTLLAACLVSGTVSAAFTEGDLVADNSITLNGEITNTNPIWAWKTGADQLDWDTTKLEWNVSGINATADFSGKGDVPLLDGYMVHSAATGVIGMEPVITISGNGYTVTAGATTVEQTAKVKVTGLTDATDNTSTVEGDMSFKLVQGAVIGWQGSNGDALIRPFKNNTIPGEVDSTKQNYRAALNTAVNNMKTSVDFTNAPYAGKKLDYSYVHDNLFASASSKFILSGYHGNINSAKVTFPSASIPEVWEGALTVTVAYR